MVLILVKYLFPLGRQAGRGKGVGWVMQWMRGMEYDGERWGEVLVAWATINSHKK